MFFLTAFCLISEGQTGIIRSPRIVTQQVQPVFTPEALKTKLIGNAAIDVVVDEAGTPAEVRLLSWKNLNSGNPDRLGLDLATIDAIRKWRFTPLLTSGKPVAFQVRIGALLHPQGSTFTNSDPEPISK